MTKNNETTAFNQAFSAEEDLPVVGAVETASTKRTDRAATAIIRLPGKAAATVSNALESVQPVDARMIEEIVGKLTAPLANLNNLFALVTDDLDALPILQSEMLWEAKAQMAQVEERVAAMHKRAFAQDGTLGDGQIAPADFAAAVLEGIREIRTPVANMEGVLSLVLDDRSCLSAPVAEMLLVAFEQLEKLAKVLDEISESANLIDGKIEVRAQDAMLTQILSQAIQRAREEGFDTEMVNSNQVPEALLPEIGATCGQCLEALLRHALLDTANYANELPIGLFVYATEAAEAALVLEIHDHCTRPAAQDQRTLNQQVVTEMAHSLGGTLAESLDTDGNHILSVTIPFAALRATTAEEMAPEATTTTSNAYQGLALLAPGRKLSRVMQDAVASRLVIQRVEGLMQLTARLQNAYLPTVLVDADLLKGLTPEELEPLEAVMNQVNGLFILQHGEADVGTEPARFPVLWDDDMLAITGMLEHPFQPGTQQENLILITGDNTSEVRPWRKLLSSTGHGAFWWPASRVIPAERFPSTIGGVVVVTESTSALSVENWNALSAMNVRDRKIIVLTGPGTCQLPRARGWDIYRPNLNVCDDTLRRYILFNAPTQQTPRVAVIEDDILMRKLLVSTIEDQAQIVEMGSVQEALAKLRTLSFDVILTDLFLPDGSGMEILKAIQNDPCLAKARSTPIIALTGSGDLELNQQVLEAGATEVLVKPVPMQVLRQKIALLTRQNRTRRISGPLQVQNTAAEQTAVTPPAAPAAPAGKRLPGVSKIINLRKLNQSQQNRAIPQNSAVGD